MRITIRLREIKKKAAMVRIVTASNKHLSKQKRRTTLWQKKSFFLFAFLADRASLLIPSFFTSLICDPLCATYCYASLIQGTEKETEIFNLIQTLIYTSYFKHINQ